MRPMLALNRTCIQALVLSILIGGCADNGPPTVPEGGDQAVENPHGPAQAGAVSETAEDVACPMATQAGAWLDCGPKDKAMRVTYGDCDSHQVEMEVPPALVQPLLPAGFRPMPGVAVAVNDVRVPPLASLQLFASDCASATLGNDTALGAVRLYYVAAVVEADDEPLADDQSAYDAYLLEFGLSNASSPLLFAHLQALGFPMVDAKVTIDRPGAQAAALSIEVAGQSRYRFADAAGPSVVVTERWDLRSHFVPAPGQHLWLDDDTSGGTTTAFAGALVASEGPLSKVAPVLDAVHLRIPDGVGGSIAPGRTAG